VVFERPYDIKLYVSERFQDPSAENATWTLFQTPMSIKNKSFVLKPEDLKLIGK
jgi:hypothetical protein